MALSFTEIYRGQDGGKATRLVQVTLDGSTTTITPANLDLGGLLFAEITSEPALTGSATWDPATSILDGDEEAKEVTVTGAVAGDFAIASFSNDVTDLALDAQITAADTATCILENSTGGAIDLASGTVKVMVFKDTGISSLSELSGVTFGPAGASGEVIYVYALGY